MYRPDRIGPAPLVEVDNVAHSLGGADFAAGDDAFPNRTVRCMDNVVNAITRADKMHTNGIAYSVVAGNSVSFGVQVNGTNPNVEQLGVMFEYYVSGIYHADADIIPNLIIGRAEDSSQDPEVHEFSFLPMDMLTTFTTDDHPSSFCAKGSCIVRDWSGGATERSTPIVLGLCFTNLGSTAQTFQDLQMSMSLYKYVSDLDTVDPTR